MTLISTSKYGFGNATSLYFQIINSITYFPVNVLAIVDSGILFLLSEGYFGIDCSFIIAMFKSTWFLSLKANNTI